MEILIPPRLIKHLQKDNKWSTCVTIATGKITTLVSGTPEFFPDYTDHGIKHINEMLTAVEKLIPEQALSDGEKDESSGILEPSDLGCLICAIMIHDLGMFLKKDGIKKLIDGPLAKPIRNSGDRPWKTAWQEYIDSTNRSSRKIMYRQFGKLIPASTNFISMDNMGDDEKKVIGEFLRRNHGRIAQEIALRGLPGSTVNDIFEGSTLDDSDRKMIGILARSHSMSIRETMPYLKAEFEEGPMPENIPVFYLMALLRIADLLDAGTHRAPALLLSQQNIQVPASEDEWKWNQCIDMKKCQWQLKKKNRSIYADPKSSVEYVLLDKWIRWVQSELDLCWSILAENYPDGYRLSIHRITSRIYQTEVQRTMRQSFLPREVSVSANPEVTQLLIAPLYGNDPSYGVRELLQNSVDACEERKFREYDPNYKGQVTIRIDPYDDPETGENVGIFTIADNGVGMNEDVLLNYYLSAGASFRSSETWKKEYIIGNRSQVARTGQFGIGFLAAFLLGDTVSVLTQHVSDELGYAFSYTNEAKPLNVVRQERPDGPGTTITIQMKEGVWEKLEYQIGRESQTWFNWYAFDDPVVQYFFNGDQIFCNSMTLFRDLCQNCDWLPLESNLYQVFLWKPCLSYESNFFCNGIQIYNKSVLYRYDSLFDSNFSRRNSWNGLGIATPHISLIDTEKQLDVDLSRNQILAFPEEELLCKQVLRYHLARLLKSNWDTEADRLQQITIGFCTHRDIYTPFLVTENCFQINNGAVLSILGTEQYLMLFCEDSQFSKAVAASFRLLPKTVPVCVNDCSSAEKLINSVFRLHGLSLDRYAYGYSPDCYCEAIWVQRDLAFPAHACDAISDAPNADHLDAVWKFQRHSFPQTHIPINWSHFDPTLFPLAIQILNPHRFQKNTSLFAQVLQEVLVPAPGYDRNDIWIPFDIEERKKKFPKAFKELKIYMDYIEHNDIK